MNKRAFWFAFGLLAAGVAIGAAVSPRLTRGSLKTLERSSDTSLESLLKEDPIAILGDTRGVYLDGYGVVFSAEVDVAPKMTPNPFRPQFTKEEIARNRETKRARISLLKEHMRSMLVDYAGALDLPSTQNVALAVTIAYSRLEDAGDMPRQIVMTAPQSALRDAKAGRPASLSASLKVQEY